MWTNDVVLQLIELFRSYECLWDTSNNNYKNKNKKCNAWEEISEILEIPRKDVETKIHNLRSQYIREKKKLKASKKTGSGTKDARKSTWFAYEPLLFLEKAETTSGDMDTMKEQQSSYWGDFWGSRIIYNEVIETVSQDSQSTNNTESEISQDDQDKELRNIQKNTRKRTNEACETMIGVKKKMDQKVMDDIDLYGQYIVAELRKMKTEKAVIMAKYYINNIIMEARMGKYDDASISMSVDNIRVKLQNEDH